MLLNSQGGSAVLCNRRNSSAMLTEDEIISVWPCGRSWISQEFCVFRFSVFLAGFMKHYYAVVCLPHICRRRWHWEDCENDQRCYVFLSFTGEKTCTVWRHYGVWLRRSICWNVGGTERGHSAYSMQHKHQNHLSHSEYCSIQPFHRMGNTMHDISFVSVGVSCFVLLIVLDIFDEFYHIICWKAGC